jgi:hypothetical protein
MAKLTKKIIDQKFRDRFNGEEIRTLITVEYNPADNSIEIQSIINEGQRIFRVDNVITYSVMSCSIDVTDLMLENFPSMENDIKAMDWESEYASSRREVAA